MNKNNEAKEVMDRIDAMVKKLEEMKAEKEKAKEPRVSSVYATITDDGATTKVEAKVNASKTDIMALMSSLMDMMSEEKSNHSEMLAEFTAEYLMNLSKRQTNGNS